MAQASGGNAQISFVEESTVGTTPGSPSMRGLRVIAGETLEASINKFESQEIRPDRGVRNLLGGNKRVQGSLPFELAPEGWGTILKHAIGPVDSTGGSSSLFTHVIKGSSGYGGGAGGLTIEKGFTDLSKYIVFKGCRINNLNMTFPQEGIVNGSLDIVGMEAVDPSNSSLGTPAYANLEPFVTYQMQIEEGGSPIANVTQCSFTLNNSIQEDGFVIGNRNRVSEVEGLRKITGQLTAFFDSTALYLKFLNETESSLRLKCRTTDLVYSVDFYFPRIEFSGETPKISQRGPINQTINWQAEIDSAVEDTDIVTTIVSPESAL